MLKHIIINFLTKYDEILHIADNFDQTDVFLRVVIYEIDVANADFF